VRRDRIKTIAAFAGFGLAVVIVALLAVVRAPVEPGGAGTFQDLRDAGYYGAQALVDGGNPYDVSAYLAAYPVGQEFPILPPIYPAAHVPLLLLDLEPAGILFFALTIAVIVALSAYALRVARYQVGIVPVLTVSALAIVSNGGRVTLIFGQATAIFVAAIYLALIASTEHPGRGITGQVVALAKPTFGLPLFVFLLALGRVKRAIAGAAIAAVLSLVLLAPIAVAAGGIGPLVDTLRANWEASFANVGANLDTSAARIDVAATIRSLFKWTPPSWVEYALGIAIVAVAVVLITRWRRRTSVGGDVVVVMICLATLAGVYHLVYDVLLLLLPVLLAVRRDFAGGALPTTRRIAVGGMLVAAFNPFHSGTFLGMVDFEVFRILGPGLTGGGVLVALGAAAWILFRLPAARDAAQPVDHAVQLL